MHNHFEALGKCKSRAFLLVPTTGHLITIPCLLHMEIKATPAPVHWNCQPNAATSQPLSGLNPYINHGFLRTTILRQDVRLGLTAGDRV